MFNSPRFKRQLIETMKYGPLVVCDNPDCKLEIRADKSPDNWAEHIAELKEYINKPCIMCGENLCTQHDFDLYVRTHKVVNWLNKYVSWLTWFASEKTWANRSTVRAHVHEKVNLTVDPKD